jgi:tubulysin polyketide synthase-like protein
MSGISSSMADLLVDLSARGIKVEAHGGSIHYRPRSAMTPDLLARVRIHKDKLLIALGQVQSTTPTIGASDKSAKSPVAMTTEEESKILRWIEAAEGLPPGSLRFYTQEELRRRFPEKKMARRERKL